MTSVCTIKLREARGREGGERERKGGGRREREGEERGRGEAVAIVLRGRGINGSSSFRENGVFVSFSLAPCTGVGTRGARAPLFRI